MSTIKRERVTTCIKKHLGAKLKPKIMHHKTHKLKFTNNEL